MCMWVSPVMGTTGRWVQKSGLKMEIWNSSEFISVQAAAKAKAQEGTLPRRDHESRKEVT